MRNTGRPKVYALGDLFCILYMVFACHDRAALRSVDGAYPELFMPPNQGVSSRVVLLTLYSVLEFLHVDAGVI